MAATITVKDGLVSTHGIMQVEFAVEGLTKEEVAVKFDALLADVKLIMQSRIEEKEYEVEVFNHSIEKLETFEADEY
ncbi:hypothetical protein [Paenisporosarcina sp. NPDC076898]|uniref:hypothetical protein n=1 Tax=unclassified Paenisporosarcina TaxID=2642018 RepID=UPI003CFC6551